MAAWDNLLQIIKQRGEQGMLLAFSGGVDSCLLAAAALEAEVSQLVTVMFISELTPKEDVDCARELARSMGLVLLEQQGSVLCLPQIADNSRQRCYACKTAIYSRLRLLAAERGICFLADGVNLDDLQQHRPGQQAAQELGFCHPLAEAGFSKQDIRAAARHLGLAVADRPSQPCLATRFPYDTQLQAADIERVQQGEYVLKQLGFGNLRLRVHGDLARIEVPCARLAELTAWREQVVESLKKLGYEYVTVDLDGLVSGRFDAADAAHLAAR